MIKFIGHITLLTLLSFFVSIVSVAQKEDNANELSSSEMENYIQEVSVLVNYLEDTYNFLGNPKTVAKEKEIVINESYLKIFKDDKVQIEDDLDENRDVPLHKDVQAYLKDIGFFYRTVNFNFLITDISHKINDDDQHFFLVSFNRDLKGITIGNDSVNTRQQRFMEINLDIMNNDMKIASIYTTRLNKREEARNWWAKLDTIWRNYFSENIVVCDSILLSNINQIEDSLVICLRPAEVILDSNMNILSGQFKTDSIVCNTTEIDKIIRTYLNQQSIDISGNENITHLSPLSEMNELTEVNCSNTLILDLTPLRNLNKLTKLDFSETPIDDISPLYFSRELTDLNCSYTLLKDLEPICNWKKIEHLNCAGIRISNLDFLVDYQKLKYLDCSYTNIHNIEVIENLKTLEFLEAAGTKVRNLEPLVKIPQLQYLNFEFSSIYSLKYLADVSGLKTLRISNTEIQSLEDLTNLPQLEKIYCDNTQIDKEAAIQFMKDHQGCLVIFESEELIDGWEALDDEWKRIAREYTSISEIPTKEELHSLLKLEDLDLSGNDKITTFDPVRRLYNLKKINIASTNLEDFSPIGDAVETEELNLSNTKIKDVEVLSKLYLLRQLNIEHTEVNKLETIYSLRSLKLIFADESGINDATAFDFRQQNPSCIIVYKSPELFLWWENLPEQWKAVFSAELNLTTDPDTKQLHQLLFLDSLNIKNGEKISSLEPLKIMKGLKYLKFSGTQIHDLTPLSELSNLTILECPQNPIIDLTIISSLRKLEFLNIENTPVSDLKPLALNSKLKTLMCSGTQISSLKPIGGLKYLQHLEINSTSIKSIKPLSKLTEMKMLKCFNTRISQKNINKFKIANPNCEVVFY